MTSAAGTESTGMMPVATGMLAVARTAASSIGRLPDRHSVEKPRLSTRRASSATTAASSVYGLLLARPIGPRVVTMRSKLGPQRDFRPRRQRCRRRFARGLLIAVVCSSRERSSLPAGANAEKHVLPRGDVRLTLAGPRRLRRKRRLGCGDRRFWLLEVELSNGGQRPQWPREVGVDQLARRVVERGHGAAMRARREPEVRDVVGHAGLPAHLHRPAAVLVAPSAPPGVRRTPA